ncbi:MAG: adaptor protein MecA [Lachnospiraceae bacterium]|nr:adaptor protein MecA [Lachnospiraceae bacterium]MCM1239195.1 adaptor protein MecA [Lachnospiraceae bacterium]MCM1304855.1 adaptor protein MecA [Butyrivibrio sp.]MCM1344441.1 adaptor protein MecA [Muribaculaceae bacterium]MCM1411147.1 adaptor protein MecA [Lachnospiraceae bacterium]
MKIEKVNENQIRCTLTREDLANRELKISELAYGTEKAKTLFRDMMRQANFEFGFEAEDIPLMIEAIPLNAECIVLIITKVDDPEELDTRFSRFAPSVTEELDDNDDFNSPADDVLDLFRRLQTDQEENAASADTAKDTASDSGPVYHTRVFLFESLPRIMEAAAIIAPHYSGTSTLYKEDVSGRYLLQLVQGEEDRDDFDRSCNIVSEYGTLQHPNHYNSTFLSEHYETLIRDNAVESLGLA